MKLPPRGGEVPALPGAVPMYIRPSSGSITYCASRRLLRGVVRRTLTFCGSRFVRARQLRLLSGGIRFRGPGKGL